MMTKNVRATITLDQEASLSSSANRLAREFEDTYNIGCGVDR